MPKTGRKLMLMLTNARNFKNITHRELPNATPDEDDCVPGRYAFNLIKSGFLYEPQVGGRLVLAPTSEGWLLAEILRGRAILSQIAMFNPASIDTILVVCDFPKHEAEAIVGSLIASGLIEPVNESGQIQYRLTSKGTTAVARDS